MDNRQLAFLDAVEADLTTPKSRSKSTVKRIGALGAALVATAAFVSLGAPPAGAAAAYSCWSPDRVTHSHTKGCGDGAAIKWIYQGSAACGPGGQYDILYFEKIFYSPCTGDVDLGLYATSCA